MQDVILLDSKDGNVQMISKKEFTIGDKVEHGIFGLGEVMGIDARAQVYEIKFDSINTVRKIQFRAQLKKINSV